MSDFPREAHTFDYPRYLKALQPVNARAQSDALYEQFLDALATRAAAVDRPLRLLEIGAGRGDQMQRVLADARAHGLPLWYEALEPNDANRAVTRQLAVSEQREGSRATIHPNDFLSFAASLADPRYDAVVARSVLDLMPLLDALSAINKITYTSWILYAPLTFGMVTRLASQVSEKTLNTENKVLSIYHNTILEKTKLVNKIIPPHKIASWANNKSGSVAMRSSDWVVNPSNMMYKNDEAYVIACILGFMYDEAISAGSIKKAALDAWWQARTSMLQQKKLIYTANQFDLLIQFP